MGGLPPWLDLVPPTMTGGKAAHISLRENDQSPLWTVPRESKLSLTLGAVSVEKKAVAKSTA